MQEYHPQIIEKKWQKYWFENKTFAAKDKTDKPKYYVLDMFPYPSGAGLHVGHPLGYIASDVYARYKRLLGFNVLHPMGYDSFGLPAEQYAIQTGQHPAVTTKTNIDGGNDIEGNVILGYRKQLDKLGFSYDWDREIRTSSPEYYKWTQWIFKQIFNSWYNKETKKAEKIETLVLRFEKKGNKGVNASTNNKVIFSSSEWNSWSQEKKEKTLLKYRLTYLSDSMVNWCPELGTVLANDEIKNGFSERGGFPVEQKKMRQWSMRITAYAERLIKDLDKLDWSESIKETQKNWIGKSKGATINFQIPGLENKIEVFTTRPETIFGVSFIVLSPEHKLLKKVTTNKQKQKIEEYIAKASLRSERERTSEVKQVTGEFTGAYAIHPFTKKKLPIWTADYVLSSYGSGAIMSVPCGDQRDWLFATKFKITIINIFKDKNISKKAYTNKDAILNNSDFLNGITTKKAEQLAIKELAKNNYAEPKTQYKLRDAVFSRQRYWGEPFPVYYKGTLPYLLKNDKVVELPKIDNYLPTNDGEPPLARVSKEEWKTDFSGDRMEANTMPGWAGSSWYFLRYIDPLNTKEFVSKEKLNYWKNVDLYVGGAEHATGHLLYSRFWTKILYDLKYIPFEEPFKKMINQGMIQGNSRFVYKLKNESSSITKKHTIYFSKNIVEDINHRNSFSINEFKEKLINTTLYKADAQLLKKLHTQLEKHVFKTHVDINLVEGYELDIKAFKKSRKEYNNAEFVLENEKFKCSGAVEKMSKSYYNVQNPDTLVEKYGADTLRCYEMFLGPLEQHKPWDTKGITGVYSFLKKFWKLFHKEGKFNVSKGSPTPQELKTIHKTIKKTKEDIDRFSFNTPVSSFMICVNELTSLSCNNTEILSLLCIILSPYAPHVTEEMWSKMGNKNSISLAEFPEYKNEYILENKFKYPISFNGKMKFLLELPKTLSISDIEKEVLNNTKTIKLLQGKPHKKVIVVPNKIVNIVI